jgi:hypothetical protein
MFLKSMRVTSACAEKGTSGARPRATGARG